MNGENACWVLYYAETNTLYLQDDKGVSPIGPLTPGSSSSLSNSHCTLNGAGTTISTSGNHLMVNFALTLTNEFIYNAQVRARATSRFLDSGWVPDVQ